MTEESKYYTPSIEEFHWGFQYEIYDLHDDMKNHIWRPQTYEGEAMGNWLLDEIKKEEIRVKKLDSVDIVFYDWKFTGEETKMGQKYTLRDNLLLFHKPYEQMVYICVQPHNEPNKFLFVFQGEIKNKSELHKILKQTSIL